jgi:hypothetical protein
MEEQLAELIRMVGNLSDAVIDSSKQTGASVAALGSAAADC